MHTKSYESLLFVRLGLNSGLRISEILNLKPQDIIYEDNQVHVVDGKGGKNRWACCDSPTLQFLRAYINENKMKNGENIFKKTPRAYQYMIDKLAQESGITRIKVTPHILRHTNITMLLEKQMPIVEVKEHAGHSDIQTTMIYTHLTYARVKKTYKEIMGE